ncbi:hypothetical protein [Treponema endosymbiont of Eucomonympha sp.]|uniref:hypothetical protein n=1 Tax=Treponema endosymbiont of Eucomonympha sp. TaxID=1580831 RepID=UPI0013969B8B|nr:hypothetical protein [Treponema endosymbiont of Eucomonympha sp.]
MWAHRRRRLSQKSRLTARRSARDSAASGGEERELPRLFYARTRVCRRAEQQGGEAYIAA